MKTPILIQFCLLTILISGCSSKKTMVTDATVLITNNAPHSVVEQPLRDGDQVISTALVSSESSESQPKMSWAGTTVVEMHDGFGNKVEHRTFPDNSLINLVVIRTPGKDQQSIEIYARNGEFRKLSVDKINLALQGTGEEIAAVVGITKTPIDSRSINGSPSTTAQTQIQNSAETLSRPQPVEVNKLQLQNDIKQSESQTIIDPQSNLTRDKSGVN